MGRMGRRQLELQLVRALRAAMQSPALRELTSRQAGGAGASGAQVGGLVGLHGLQRACQHASLLTAVGGNMASTPWPAEACWGGDPCHHSAQLPPACLQQAARHPSHVLSSSNALFPSLPVQWNAMNEAAKELQEAVRKGEVESVRRVLAAAPDAAALAAAVHEGSRNVLHLAAATTPASPEIVRLLLDVNPYLDTACDWSQRKPAHYAAICGHTEILRLLLSAAPSAAALAATPDVLGRCPLHYAVVLGRHDSVRQLLDAAPACTLACTPACTPEGYRVLHASGTVAQALRMARAAICCIR